MVAEAKAGAKLKTDAEAELGLKAKAESDLRFVVDIEYAEGCATVT